MSVRVQLVCVEVGGSSIESVFFAEDGSVSRYDGAQRPVGTQLAIASPGLIGADGRVLGASNLGWFDVDPVKALGLGAPAALVLNDAEAAALGEMALRGASDGVFIGLGTGVGAAVVEGGVVVASNLIGHIRGFSSVTCTCGNVGCLETVAGGWALPTPLSDGEVATLSAALCAALDREPRAVSDLVVLGGGLARRYPGVRDSLAACASNRVVENSAAPEGYKSASAWGLRHALNQAVMRS